MTTDQSSVNAYLRTKVLTASPEELRLMLLDGAIKFAEQAREGIVAKDFERSYNGFTQCRAIITELITSIRPEFDPELFGKVRSLYTFMYSRLVEASTERDIQKVDEVLKLLGYERETWVLLMEKLTSERAAAAGSTASGKASQPSFATSEAGGGRPAFSFEA